MKRIMKVLLAATGIILAGFGAYILWDVYAQKKEMRKKALEAEQRAAFIARRRARARAKAEGRLNLKYQKAQDTPFQPFS